MYEDEWERIVQDVHAYVDNLRASKGLKPFDWKGKRHMSTSVIVTLHEKYPYSVDTVKERFDASKMEEIRVDDQRVIE